MILAIDPGPTESAYVILGKNLKPVKFAKIDNLELLNRLKYKDFESNEFEAEKEDIVIEMVASYGMAVGAEVFETVFWIGRFWEAARPMTVHRIYRKDEKTNLCHSMKANDSNIRQALIDRFGPVGVKKNPGWFYGVSKDIWAAIAVGVTYYDMHMKEAA